MPAARAARKASSAVAKLPSREASAPAANWALAWSASAGVSAASQAGHASSSAMPSSLFLKKLSAADSRRRIAAPNSSADENSRARRAGDAQERYGKRPSVRAVHRHARVRILAVTVSAAAAARDAPGVRAA